MKLPKDYEVTCIKAMIVSNDTLTKFSFDVCVAGDENENKPYIFLNGTIT